jgi:hypothetical protein
VQVQPSFVFTEEARHLAPPTRVAPPSVARAPEPSAGVAETADITAFVPRAPLPFAGPATPAAAVGVAPASAPAVDPLERPGSGTEDITALVRGAAIPFVGAGAAQTKTPAAPPHMRLVRFDPQTGQPLAEPRWEPMPGDSPDGAPQKR